MEIWESREDGIHQETDEKVKNRIKSISIRYSKKIKAKLMRKEGAEGKIENGAEQSRELRLKYCFYFYIWNILIKEHILIL